MQTTSRRLIYAGFVLIVLLLATGISSAEYADVELVGHAGEVVSDVAVDRDYAYIGEGQDLVLLDITDDFNPSEVGRVTTPSIVIDICVSGNYAYIADGEDGLVIVDVSDPSAPTITSNFYTDKFANGVAVEGNYAYVADRDNGLMIVDITNSSAPTLAGSYYTSGWAQGIDVSENYAYVTDAYNGNLIILDISDPSAPSLAGNYDTEGGAMDVAVSGNYAYIADDHNGLVILDIKDTSVPTLAGSYYTYNARDVAVAGNYVYVVDDENGLIVVDISDPSTPKLAGNYDTAGHASGIAVAGNYAYVADDENGFVILHVEIVPDTAPLESVTNLQETSVGPNWITWTWENPYDSDFSHVMVYIDGAFITNTSDWSYNSAGLTEGVHTISTKTVDASGNIDPTWVNDSARTATVNMEFISHIGGRVSDVAVVGDHAYVGQGQDLVVFDITNVDEPSEVGRVPIISMVTGIAVSGNHAYVTNYSDLVIVDISKSSSPRITGSYKTYGYVSDVVVAGNYAYVADYENGLMIVDITDPSAPTLAGSYDVNSARNIASLGNYVYIASDNGLTILDITDRSSPIPIGSYQTDDPIEDVAVAGNYAYVAAGWLGFGILDITTPSTPTLAGSYDTPGGAEALSIADNYAYVAAGNSLEIVDISDPLYPRYTGSCDIAEWTSAIVVSGDHAYIAAGEEGLVIVDITDPSSPEIAVKYVIACDMTGVTISNNYAYVTDGINGLEIFDISDPASPELVGRCDTGGYVHGVTVSGNYAYLIWSLDAGTHHSHLEIVDIGDPTSPSLVGGYANIAPSSVVVEGNYAYVSSLEGGTEIVDITDPSSTALVGKYGGNVIAVAEGYAYASTGYNSLEIVDITNPISPKITAIYETYGYVNGVVVEGNYAYIGDENGLFILDISNPASPVLKGRYDTANFAGIVAVAEGYAYVLDGSGGLLILNITDPSSPELAGSYSTGWGLIAISDSYAYMPASGNGLFVFRIGIVSDTIPPASVTNLGETETGPNWINWTWTNPGDIDFSHVMLYMNGTFVTNTSGSSVNYYNATGLTEGTAYTIGIHTVDTSGNINNTWMNDSAITTIPADITPPASVTDLGETETGPNWINWTWTNPGDTDFSHVMLYMNGIFVTNTSGSSVNYYNATGLTEGTAYTIGIHTVDASGNINNTWTNDSAITTIPADITPPAAVTSLKESSTGTSWISWTWTNPGDTDFSHVMVYMNGTFVTNTSGGSVNYYNATGLTEGTAYTIGIHTVDASGNINNSWTNDSAITTIPADITPPASVTDLGETETGPNWINWTWTNPRDTDFSHVMVYMNGTFVTNTSGSSVNYYNATGLTEGTAYTIGIHTVDSSGNINNTWMSDSAITTIPADITPPASVTDLGETETGPNWINWTWTNPGDTDFSHVMLYMNGIFVTNTSGSSVNYYNATGLAEGTAYTIGIHTVDASGNINNSWTNDSAITTIPADITPPVSVTDLGETDTGPTWINWTWTNPGDTDFSHVMLYMNGIFVTNTSGSSVNYYNATGLTEGTAYTIGIHTVDASGNINNTWTNDPAATVKLPKIFGLSGTNITTSSVTLIWEASSDTYRAEIVRDNILIGDVRGATTYVDRNLSSGTTYSYTLIPYTVNGLAGKAVSISLKTASPSSGSGGGGGSSTSKTSSGGGGAGAGSAEDFTNVVLKDVDTEYLAMNTNVTYEFAREGNPIHSVSFYSLKNSGQITSTIEVLHNRSKLVKTNPEGLIYNYVNIWMGKSGFATASNIKDASIRFKVTSSWLEEMGVNPADVRLQRYNGNAWEVLPTTIESNTTGYVMFESRTPGFSPFVITAEKAVVTSVADETVKTPIRPEDAGVEETQPERSGIWTFMLAILIIGVLAVGYAYLNRRQN